MSETNSNAIHITLAIPKIDSMNDLLLITEDTTIPEDNLLGELRCLKSNNEVFVNTTGKNDSLDDWYCIKSANDTKFISIMRQICRIDDTKTVVIDFKFDYETTEVMVFNEVTELINGSINFIRR